MSFLNPTAFWGLLALVIPTIILLMSKQKQQVIEFGSLEFLEPSESKTARKIYPSQWLLFLLRLAIMTLLILMIAEPVLESKETEKKILIEKNVYEDPAFEDVLKRLGENVEIIDPRSLSVLITKLNTKNDSVVVYSRSYEKDFIGSVPILGPHIDWRIVPNERNLQFIDTLGIGESINELSITSGEDGLKWNAEPIKTEQLVRTKEVSIIVLHSSNRANEKAQLQAMLNAYERVIPMKVKFTDEDSDWMILIDTIVARRSRKNIMWNHFDGPLTLSSYGTVFYEIQGLLTRKNISASNFPLELAHVLLEDQFSMKDLDRRIFIPEQSSETIPILNAQMEKEGVKYLWILIVLLLLFERWLSRKSLEP